MTLSRPVTLRVRVPRGLRVSLSRPLQVRRRLGRPRLAGRGRTRERRSTERLAR
ncbi:hypothetical protein GCM10009665_34980 [Kitasatospora nipponensis]|uniref:DUF4236 domain-containing protein n=1 Tax=Kitasatospora nipponensis TaxID=258049 RepID=A0ABN1W8Z8_9ACTN